MNTPADILDAAALLALRIDVCGVSQRESRRETVREVGDALAMLIERWQWDLLLEASRPRRDVANRLGDANATGESPVMTLTQVIRSQVEIATEILATELLVRVYSALQIAQGGTAIDAEVKLLVDEVTSAMNKMGQFVRQRCMLSQAHLSCSFKLYRLQKRLDRWSDILLAPTLHQCRLEHYRMSRLDADDWSNHPWNQMADRDVAAALLRRAIQSAVPGDTVIPASRSRFVERLLAATLMLISETDFTSDGQLMTRRQARASVVSSDSYPRPRPKK